MKGMFDKYEIGKRDGSLVDPNARYFVLRLDTDRHARAAAAAYAKSIRRENPTLASDIIEILYEIEGQITAEIEEP